MVDIRTHYLDASAIVKLFIDEIKSEELRAYLEPHATRFVTSFCLGEALGVFKVKYKRKNIDSERYFAACEDLMANVRDGNLVIDGPQITNRMVFDAIEQLATRYRVDLVDAHLLYIVRIGGLSRLTGDSQPILITADKGLAAGARGEKLRVWDVLNESP